MLVRRLDFRIEGLGCRFGNLRVVGVGVGAPRLTVAMGGCREQPVAEGGEFEVRDEPVVVRVVGPKCFDDLVPAHKSPHVRT